MGGRPWCAGLLSVIRLCPTSLRVGKYHLTAKSGQSYLRKGMKWSDGHPFTADDILYQWDF